MTFLHTGSLPKNIRRLVLGGIVAGAATLGGSAFGDNTISCAHAQGWDEAGYQKCAEGYEAQKEDHYVDWYQGVKGCCTGFDGVWHDQQPGQEARCYSGAELRYPARWRDIRSAHARSTAAGETAAGDDPRDARTGRPWLAAVRLCVFAGRAGQHRTEVVDEMRLVVPAEAYRQVREVDAGVTLDLLKCSLL